ncbi:isochorismate synthase [Lactococcus termiticola]|uniref:isochorismate synthase n=1 Tax=Lactococcus termiticola TaxID=2169526 RepID=A0A2R5HJ09_9LACT|nr:isochorismate synthase [Lactococcus termiticola]GBG96420.1 isochorismate synthase [Lactococcus termiticola]
MTYIEKTLQLNDPLNFWQAFDQSDDRFFWYGQGKIIIGAGISDEPDAPYRFYWQDFFDSEKKELLSFKHYFVMTEGRQSYYYSGKAVEILEQEIPLKQHDIAEEVSDYASWQRLFDRIMTAIQSGQAEKIVASRQLSYTSPEDFDIPSILKKLMLSNPENFVFAFDNGSETFLGASPEILVQKENSAILSYALAGTASKASDPDGQMLLADPKNKAEHAIVVKKIRDKMQAKAQQVSTSELHLMSLKNVFHLRTLIQAEDDATSSLTDWASFLHPTPALGGEPSDVALKLLKEHEGYERGHYAAPLGVLDSEGNGTIIVGIRSATIKDNQLTAYAGCGLVAGSDCQAEFDETQVKLKTILEAL